MKKNPHAVALGRKGGHAKVSKGFGKRPRAERIDLAREAAKKRWGEKS